MRKILAALLLAVLVGPAYGQGLPMYSGVPGSWDDTMVPALSTRAGASAPDDCDFLADATLTKALCFDGATTTEEVHFTVQIPHGYQEGTELQPHVHFSTAATSGSVVFQLEYTVSEINGVFPATTTIECGPCAAAAVAWTHQICGCDPDINDADLNISSIMYGRLFRDPTHASDDLTSDVAMIGFDIHFFSNTTGSRQPTTK